MPDEKPLDSMSLDELETLMQKPAEPGTVSPEPEVPAEEIQPTEETEKEDSKKDSEPQSPKPSQEDLDKEILRQRLEAAEAASKKWEQIAGRHGGELGFLKNRIKEIESRVSTLRSAPQDTYEPAEEVARETATQVQAPKSDAMAAWAVSQAIGQAAASFDQKHPDVAEFRSDVEDYIKSSGYNAADLIGSSDPIWAAQETNRFLEEAYWHAKMAHKERVISDLEKKRADQIPKMEELKKKAVISASGATPAPKPPQRSLNDMTLDELEKELRRLTKR